MRQPGRAVRFPGWVVSLVLAAEAVNRATSFLLRPPDENGLSLIEERMHYSGWAGLLLGAAVLLVGGITTWLHGYDHGVWFAFLGHFLLLVLVGVFASSVALSALFKGEPWSGFGPLAVVCFWHSERLLCTGANIGKR